MGVQSPVKINKFALALVLLISSGVSVTPVAMLIGHPRVALFVSLSSGVVAIIALWGYKRKTFYKPNLAEFLIAGIDSIWLTSFLGLLWSAAHFLVFGVVRLVEWLLNVFGGSFSFNADAVAYYSTTPLAVLTILAIIGYETTSDMTDKLYPQVAGLRSVYVGLFTTNWETLRNTIYITVPVLIGATLLLDRSAWYYYLLLQFVIFLASTPIMSESEELFEKRDRSAVDLVIDLFEEAGYYVEESPRTDDPSIDPLLLELDLMANRDGKYVFVDVKAPPDDQPPIDNNVPSSLRQAAEILSHNLDLPSTEVDARLILVDIPYDEKLARSCKIVKVKLITLTRDAINSVFDSEIDDQTPGDDARSLLGLPDD
jgi:hypothetical protein